MKVGFIGLGNMAGAMIGGMVNKSLCQTTDIYGADASGEARKKAEEKYGIKTFLHNKEIAKEADIIVLSVKPQFYEVVINEIKDIITERKIILTIAPGKTILWLTDKFEKQVKIVRCMPNTPALVSEGCTGVCKNELVTEEELHQILNLLNSFGKSYEIQEYLMDTVVAISGSSPAYVFMMIEAMADAGVAGGLPRALAYELAAQAVLGSAKMVLETGKHPGELKDMVCSPGGTTIEAVKVLELTGFRSSIMEAMEACIEKSKNI